MKIFKLSFIAIFALSALVACPTSVYSQKNKEKKDKKEQKEEKKNKNASTAAAKPVGQDIPGGQARPGGAAQPKGPQELSKFVKKDAKIKKGFTTVYQQDDKWYININDSIIGRDLMMVSRISKSAEGGRSGFSGYAGDQITQAMIRFSKGPGNKIFIERVLLREKADGPLKENVKKSNTNALVASFDVVANDKSKGDNLIELTNFLVADSPIIYFGRSHKRTFGLQNFQKDRSYVSGVKTYPINTEMKSVITYGKEDGSSATYEFNVSVVLLPKEPMKPRYQDPRVGYFVHGFVDFDRNPQGVKRTSMIARWRLEPKPEDMEKYKAGELVEPQKPIVIYIDPSTPKEWVPYLIMGVNDWQVAFEQAGFKNAIRAEVAPTFEQDSTWSLEDATHSAIVYKPSDIENASGPHVSDPRSGEIIETHINWYHNVMRLLRDWYIIQCSPSDPMARSMELPTELMGQLIRFVSSHEVGHTLGLRHNFAGSSTPIYTVANLKNVDFLKKYGHATSIMDYARFDYLAQAKDNIPQELLFPCIGPYDKWAIEWGYRYYPQFATADDEVPYLRKLVSEKVKDPIYKFGTESDPSDPRFQSEDLGVNQMESNEVGIENLKYIMNNFEKWTKTPNEQYENTQEIYTQIVGQYQRYVNHVAKWVGGIFTDQKFNDEPGDIRTYVSKAKQKEAMNFLNKHLFKAPRWLVPENLFKKINSQPDAIINQVQRNTLRNLISQRVLTNLYRGEILNGTGSYTIENYFADLNSMIFAPAPANPTDAAYQRSLQKNYVQILCDLYSGANAQTLNVGGRSISTGTALEKDNTDVSAMVLAQLENLRTKFKTNSQVGSTVAKAHNKLLYDRVNRILTEPRPATPASSMATVMTRFYDETLPLPCIMR